MNRLSRISGRAVLYLLLALFALYYIAPLYVMLSTSFKSLDELRSGNLLSLPAAFDPASTAALTLPTSPVAKTVIKPPPMGIGCGCLGGRASCAGAVPVKTAPRIRANVSIPIIAAHRRKRSMVVVPRRKSLG